jgi:hypothetical protein
MIVGCLKYAKAKDTKIKIWGQFWLSEATAKLQRTLSEPTPKLQNQRKRHFENIYQ